jgi:exodeoxyribonuclease VII large subunit
VRAELLVSVTSFGIRAMSNLRRALEARRSRFLAAARGLPRRAEILELPRQRLDYASGRLPRALLANARAHRSALERCAARLRPHIVARAATSGRERLIRLERSRERALAGMIERARRKLDGQAKLLSTLSYQNVLARGFTLVRGADGAMLRRASEVKPGAALDIEFADGHIGAHADPRARKPEVSAKEPRKPADGKQGTLL